MSMDSPSPRPPPPVTAQVFENFTRANTFLVRRLIQRAGVPASDEQDLIQEVFLALHLALRRDMHVAASLRAWLKITTYRIARDHMKLTYNAREVLTKEGEIDAQDDGPGQEEHMERIELRRLINELLDELPPYLRLVLVMSDADNLPMSEIASLLGIKEGTGYTRLRAARREFASAWERRRTTQAPDRAALGIAPFLLFDAASLLDLERETTELPDGLEDEVWYRLVQTLGPALSWTGAGAAVAAGKSTGIVLSATQVAFGVAASALAGAGIYVLIAALRADPPPVTSRPTNLPVTVAFPQSADPSPAPIPLATASATATVTPSPTADAGAAMDGAPSEIAVLERARAALGRAALASNARRRDREIAAARAGLAEHERRFPDSVFAGERDALRRQILAYETTHQVEDGGHP